MNSPWDSLGLAREPGRRDRFVCTDNLTGWYEGFTHSTHGRGYFVRDAFVLAGWSASLNGRPLDRGSKAVSDTVYPWGHRVDYPEAREELLLHSGRRILSFRVTSPVPADAAIELVWNAVPEGLFHDRVDQEDPNGITVHVVFGETEEELKDNRAAAQTADLWEIEVAARWTRLTRSWLVTDDEDYNRALFWAAASAQGFVAEEFGTGLWAGLPWFKDNWGRDTFIALPGTLLCTGAFTTAREVLANFARFQCTTGVNRGRVPNRVNAQEILYNTVDGTPWLIRELEEYLRHTGDRAFARSLRPLIRRYVDGALANFVDAEGLLRHDDADTWMDARILGLDPWSPRGDRAVEIQALWIEALEVGTRLARADKDQAEAEFYSSLVARARQAFTRRFVVEGRLVDRVDAADQPDTRLRPNALMLAGLNETPVADENVLRETTRQALGTLILPWGVLSLDPAHADFHPHHENPARWHKDAAYHNGTIWGWNAGFAITALNRFGWQDRSWELTKNLTRQILETGCVGTMSELVDALGSDPLGSDPTPTGTFSQAWSVSEFVRNAYQDYLGWRPDLPRAELMFRPALPLAWTTLQARLPYGAEAVTVTVEQTVGAAVKQSWTWEGPHTMPLLVLELPSATGRERREIEPTGIKTKVEVEFPLPPEAPAFATLERPAEGWPVERGTEVLQKRILNSR